MRSAKSPFAVAAVLVATLLAPGVTERPVATSTTDLRAWLGHRVSLMDDSDPYRTPTDTERSIGAHALLARENGKRLSSDASSIGLSATSGVDSSTGRRFSILASETETNRSWGAVILDRSRPVRLVIEVPHPKDDINTWLVGLTLFRKVSGSALVVAGSTRHAGTGADVAHAWTSMFQSYAGHLARQAGREVQIHGYADSSLPGVDAVPSPGPTSRSALHTEAYAALTADGENACPGMTSDCGNLLGTKNRQGTAAKGRGSKFLHIETSRTARDSSSDRVKIASAVASTWGLTT